MWSWQRQRNYSIITASLYKGTASAVPIPDPEIEKKKKLLIYDPTLHDYTISKPQWVEITEGHFVYGNEPELEKYRAEIDAINAAERT